MSGKLLGAAFAIGILVLSIAVVFPALMGAGTAPQTETVQVDVNQTEAVGGEIMVAVDEIDANASNATLRASDSAMATATTVTIDEGETTSLELADDGIEITLVDLREDGTAVLRVEYSATHGWSDGAMTFVENMDLLLGLLALLLVVALLVGVMQP